MARFSKGPWRIVKRTDKPGHRPMADEPHSLIDSWPFLISFGVVVLSLLWAASQGRLP